MLIIVHADQRYFNGNKILTSDNIAIQEIASVGGWANFAKIKTSESKVAIENLTTARTLNMLIFWVHQY